VTFKPYYTPESTLCLTEWAGQAISANVSCNV